MLTPEEIEAFRRKVASHRRFNGPFIRIDLYEGPLDGMRVPIPLAHRYSPSVTWGMFFRRGLVVARYVPTNVPDVWTFEGYECHAASDLSPQ